MSDWAVSFAVKSARLEDLKGAVVALAVLKEEDEARRGVVSDTARRVDALTGGAVVRAITAGAFEPKRGSSLLMPGWGDNWVVLVGLGPAKKLNDAAYRRAGAAAMRAVRDFRAVDTVASLLAESPFSPDEEAAGLPSLDARTDAVVEGFCLGAYRFDGYRTKKEEKSGRTTPPRVVIVASDDADVRGIGVRVERARVMTEGQLAARDLANVPPNVANPAFVAAEARAIAKRHGLSCRVLDVAELKRRKMHGILAVGQGSANPPCLIVLEHKPTRSAGRPYKRVAVVGKGITFDTGGISIKPADKMELMKFDKSGACVVLAVMATVAQLKLPLHVVGLAAMAENMPSGAAYRPGDILTMMNGKTVEVLSTDAEGRMVLADALHHAGSFKPDAVVDLATLTGAIDVALGKHYAGLMATSDDLAAALERAAAASGEKVWRMPIGDEYQEQIKGTHADIANLGGRSAGALTAAQFLANFAPKDVPWAHLDIAGTSWSEKDEPEAVKGATGFGVRLVSRFLLGLVEGDGALSA